MFCSLHEDECKRPQSLDSNAIQEHSARTLIYELGLHLMEDGEQHVTNEFGPLDVRLLHRAEGSFLYIKYTPLSRCKHISVISTTTDRVDSEVDDI